MTVGITVALPTYNTPTHMLTQAVESLLNQTYTDIRVVVVNDGGKPVKLPTDPRIVLFEADRNRGCYYSESLVLAACKTEWWTVHASDDWSDPHRFQTLLDASQGVEAVTSPTIYHWPDRDVHDPVNTREQGHGTLGTISRHPAHIYRAETIRTVGIPSDLRGSADTAVVSLFWHRHPVQVVDDPMYHVRKWDGSLTAHPATALGSDWRKQQRAERRRRFNNALANGGPLHGFAPDQADVKRLRGML
jgi:cellulose synthase/poly-beta-1,6-N-acetylglucosamine synthase-like glycosyltransferase